MTKSDIDAITLITHLRGDRSVEAITRIREQLAKIEKQSEDVLNPFYWQYLDAVEAFRNDNLDSAIDLFRAFLSAVEIQHSDNVLFAYANVYLGTIFASRGEFYRALDFFTTAEGAARGNDHILGLFLHINLGGIYIDLERFDKARDHSEKAIEHGKYVDHSSNISLAYCNLAISLANLDLLDQALDVVELSSKLSFEQQAWHSYTYSRFYYALVLSRLGRTKEAFSAYKEAFELVKKYADTYLSIEFYDHYSRFLYDCGHYQFTVKFCEKAIESPGISDNSSNQLSLLETLAKCYEKLGDLTAQNRVLKQSCKAYKALLKQTKDNEINYIDSILLHNRMESEAENSDVFTRHLSYLNDLGQMIASTEDHETDVLRLFEHIGEIIPCTAFSLALYREDSDVLEYKYLLEEGEFQPSFEVECSCVSRIGIYALKNRTTVVLDTSSDNELTQYLDSGCAPQNIWINAESNPVEKGNSAICTPVLFEGEALGVISVQKSESYAYKDFHVQVVTQLANYIAVALKNRLQRQELEDNQLYMEEIYRTDHLTGLKNRFGLRPYLEQLQTQYGTGFDIATLLIDVDYLKAFNNSYGMARGDDLLVTIADILRHVSKGQGEAFRIGGDEFAIILPYPQLGRAVDMAKQIKAHLVRSAIENQGAETESYVTVTIGVVDSGNMHDVGTFEQEVLTGERALIKAKKHQRNRLLKYSYTN